MARKKKNPTFEVECIQFNHNGKPVYIVGSDREYQAFYLYEIKDDGSREYFGEDTNPTELERRFKEQWKKR